MKKEILPKDSIIELSEREKIKALQQRLDRLERVVETLEKRLRDVGILNGYKSAWQILDEVTLK